MTMSFSLTALLMVLVASQIYYTLSVGTANAEEEVFKTVHNLAVVITVFGILEAIGLFHIFLAAVFKHMKDDDVEF